MYLGKLFLLLSILLLVDGCQQKSCTLSYPEFISNNGLEAIYDKAKLDWYLLNATDYYSRSEYLVVYDSIVDADTRIRDTTDSYWTTNYELLENKEKMIAKFGPDRIREFVNTDLTLFIHDEETIVVNDTIRLTFFPEDDYRGQLLDRIDGAIHTLIYVNGVLTTVGKNDYIEYDVEADEVRGLLPTLTRKLNNADQATNWLKCQIPRFSAQQ